MDKKEYQYHLLTVMGHPRYRLANNFNFSSLKRRIIMMNKIRSARLHLLRFLFLLPLLAVILLAFRGRYPKPGRHNGPVFVNAAGIVIGLPEKTPLAGVTVQVTGTPLQAVTDANGYYKLRIPVTTDSIRIHLDYTKRGFEPGSSERFWPTLRGTTGIVDVEGLTSTAPHKQEFFFIAPGFHRQPVDPSYPDAAAELQRVLAENRQMRHQKEVLAEHPDIGMFYVTEDKKRRLVIHTDGTTERYGYPGTPSLATMDRNYGTLPWMTPDGANTNRGYLDRWASISAQAERQFHPTGGNPRAIIFPGDSRVIAVDASGKVQVYDMDNTIDPKERSRFERLYGKLPPCVPDKGSVVPVITHNEQDTTKPVAVITGPTTGSRSIHRLDTANVLYIVNGEIMPPGFNYNTIPAADIVSMDVLKGDQGIRLFGEKGVNGVVAFTTKASFQQRTKPVSVQLKYPYVAQPLYVVDGIFSALGDSALRRLNPSQIESITVLKDSAGIARYGDWGRNGVILITTKKGRFGIGK
jgi:TonB-dependent SusC/RagA subfamily outer membrane receptor